MTIDRPIFLIGSIRSGTTITYNLLSLHPQLCWFSNHSNRFVNVYGVPFLQRFLNIPFFHTRQARAIFSNRRMFSRFNFVPWPDEGDEIYHAHSGLGRVKDGVETEFTDEMERAFKTKIREHLEMSGKPRFLSKQTANNRRLAILDKMFPDAFYVHVIRDGRAVANSTYRVPWWEDTYIWWLGTTAAEWNRQGREPIELCGLHWMNNVQQVLRTKDPLAPRYLEVRYEELTNDVRGVIKRICDFCELDDSGRFVDELPESLPDMNLKWREQLDVHQQRSLHDSIGEFLVQLGYTVD
jgi:hypothetical protein